MIDAGYSTNGKAHRTRFDGAWLDSQTFPDLHWIVPGIIAEGLTVLVAPPKAGKSWLVYWIAIARAMGGVALGQRLSQGPVLYFALEDGQRRLQERGRKLLAPGEHLPAAIEYKIALEPGETVVGLIREFVAAHHGQHPVVIIDTFGKVKPTAPKGVSAYEHDYAVVSALKAAVDSEPGAALILVHHDRKAATADFVDAVSGTHGIAGAADAVVVIQRPRNQRDAMLCVTGRDVTETEYAATFDAGRWELTGDSLAEAQRVAATTKITSGLGDKAAVILAAVVANTDGYSTRTTVAEATGLDVNLVGDYLARLARSGKLTSVMRGHYAAA